MDALLDQLRHFGLNPRPFPDRPPPWPELRAELRGHAPRLAADALGCWYELFQWNYYLWAIRLFEAACEADTGPAEFETFALGARQLLGRFGPRAPVPAAFHEFLAGTAHHNAFDHKRRQPLAVWRGLYGFFFARPCPSESGAFGADEFRHHLDRLTDHGLDFEAQEGLLTNWLAVWHPDDWRPVLVAVKVFFDAHGLAVDSPSARRLLAYWLRAVAAYDGPPEDAPDAGQVLAIGSRVLASINGERAGVTPAERAAFDDESAFGYYAWAIAALSRYLDAGPYRPVVSAASAQHLEGFSGRMALNNMSRPAPDASGAEPGTAPTPGPVVPAGGCPGRWSDPLPDAHPQGVEYHIGDPLDALFAAAAPTPGPLPASAAGTPSNPARPPLPDELSELLGATPHPAQWDELIPHGAAFLGTYELPRTHRPCVVLAHHRSGEVVWDVAIGPAPSPLPGPMSALSEAALMYQRQCDEAWTEFGRRHRDAATTTDREAAAGDLARQLCLSLTALHEDELNPAYGPLIDAVVRGVGGAAGLSGADLIFCPRGPLNAAAPALVGGTEGRLGRMFQSITVCPALALFAHLRRRAADPARAVPPTPRLNVLTWFEDGPARRLVGRAVGELADRTDLWLAAASPMSTLARAERMTAEGHWTLLLAHGRSGPDGTGVWVADGLFPGALAPRPTGDGTGALFLLSCVAGRMAATPPYLDAFGPISEEVVLSFCLSNRLRRPPTLVGAFTQIVEGHVAADLGAALVRRRLDRRGEAADWCGFARAALDHTAEVMGSSAFRSLLGGQLDEDARGELVAASGEHAVTFLYVHGALHFRLTGCEPTLAR